MTPVPEPGFLRSRDFLAGALFIGLGLVGVTVGSDYPIGSARQMGPGYFPMAISIGLVTLGAAIAGRGILRRTPVSGQWTIRPLAFVILAILVFAALLEMAGLVIAAVALVGIGRIAEHEFRTREIILLSVGLAAFAVGVFVEALGLPISVWPQW